VATHRSFTFDLAVILAIAAAYLVLVGLVQN
jgi:hypothetical protein